MRGSRRYIGELNSSFLSCEKDTELIIKKLFVDSQPHSNALKKLLIVNEKDCLDAVDTKYQEYTDWNVNDIVKKGYVRLQPKLQFGENEDLKSYIIISFDDFTPNYTNAHYRDCVVMIDIICHPSVWELGNYRQRPIKIAGYIDGILNNSKLTGIGTLEFVSAGRIILSEDLAGYCLVYRAVHSDDDTIEPEDE